MATTAGIRVRRGLIAVGLLLVGLIATAPPAGATTIFTHPFVSSFDSTGSKTAGGAVGPFGQTDHVAVDQATGTVYVLDTGKGVLSKFEASGAPSAFSALGAGVNSIAIPNLGGFADVVVDNSGTSTQSQIYAFGEGQPAHAFLPTGVELGGNFPLTPVGDQCGAAIDPQGNFWWSRFGGAIPGYNSAGFPLGKNLKDEALVCHIAFNTAQPPSPTSGYFYLSNLGGGQMEVFDAAGNFKYSFDAGGSYAWTVNPSNGNLLVNNFDHVSEWAPSTTETPGAQVSSFGGPDPVHGFPEGMGTCGPRGIAVNKTTNQVYVGDCGKVDIFAAGQALVIPTVSPDEPEVTPSTAILRGVASTDGAGDTTACKFEYGPDTNYGNAVACATPSGPIHDADGAVEVRSAEVKSLEPGNEYHFRLVVTNSNGVSRSADRAFKPQGPPVVSAVYSSEVNTDSARLNGTVDPGGTDTRYRFDWGLTDSYGNSIPLPDFKLVDIHAASTVTEVLHDLQGGTTYHYRLVATNGFGSDDSGDQVLTTYPQDSFDDDCANANVRRQTLTTLLLDCRAYELVSARDGGGYDVESDLVPGQVVLPASPSAPDRLLYSMHHGKIPGIAGPSNLGIEPYVAERGNGGWTTTFVGIPSGATPATQPFGSPLAEANQDLSTFAFAGTNICNPCFDDDKIGIPVHAQDGNLVQGMAGSLDPGPAATTAGYVGRALSADGTHLIFGSTSKFEPDGNSNGDVTIYARNLGTGVTDVVSKTTGGTTMTGSGIGELDVSADGSRVLFGRTVVPDDSAGNHYWHLYMNIGGSGSSVDVTPGATNGVLYAGMTGDGSSVFFNTADPLLGSDLDSSADLYEADVSAGGVTLTLVSSGTGGAGNSNACNPGSTLTGPHWNSVGAIENCGTVAFAGGSGVAADDGSVYFVSPEKLDGTGTLNSPNLFVRRPGSAPHRIATLELENTAIRNGVRNNEVRNFGDFQVTPGGDDALFASASPLTGYPVFGHTQLYRYDAPSDELDCVSCPPSGAAPTGSTVLSTFGLNIDDEGDVFFTTPDQLVLRDSNKKKDAYEWEDGVPQLISPGTGVYDTGLVSISSDGVNAFFYTRQVLVPEDENGAAMKVYVARAGGGFPVDPPLLPCQASDECHGPGSQAAPPPDIGTFKGTGGNLEPGATQKKKKHKKKKHKKKKRQKQKKAGRR